RRVRPMIRPLSRCPQGGLGPGRRGPGGWVAGGQGARMVWRIAGSGSFPGGRSRGVTGAVDGFFALVWFGWGQADAPSWLVVPPAVGTGLAALLAVAGVVAAARSTGQLSAVAAPEVRRR